MNKESDLTAKARRHVKEIVRAEMRPLVEEFKKLRKEMGKAKQDKI